ncbi:flagellar hook-length control protein FliK [Sphingomonas cavernae]|uniref:Flagellar hook-length control protein FliK n=1 Tax=Sphingomonas cavernae TaxID=2320861 RepID=A0A418WPP4_9SPHN|nr:flagellar hook-length control protein FliK [Sphingomonas cavernae]RJF93222.1 flagellar hook-length control protein FliK [Sphingomonas cavernae]
MMLAAGGLNLEAGLTLRSGIVTGQDAASDTGFTRILAALDAGAVAIAAPLDPAVLMPAPAELIVAPEGGSTNNPPMGADEVEDATHEADKSADAATVAPFVAPPIPIGVSNARPIVVDQTFVAPRSDAVCEKITTGALAAAILTDAAADTVAADKPPAHPDALVAALAKLEATAPRFTLPITPQPVVEGKASPPVAIPVDSAQTMVSAADPLVVAAQPDAPAAPVLSTVTAPVAADPTRLGEAAPDTARQLGEQAVSVRLDVANEAEMIDRLARDLAQLSGAEGRLKFQLNPEHLGSLHVEVEQRAEGVLLRFGTETEGARQVIADAQHRLVNEARAQGMRIAETHVDLSSQNQQGSARDNRAQQPVVITRGETADASMEAGPARRAGAERFA